MGKQHSASGWKQWEDTNKPSRKAIRKARESYKKHPTGVRCTLCGQYVEKLQQVRRPDGAVVPGCADCAKKAREAAKATEPKLPAFLLASEPPRAAPAPAQASQKPLLALPAPRMNAYMRPIRRQLALMVGPRPRHIPTGPAIALGPGDKPSPYKPEEIQKWYGRLIGEMDEAIRLSAMYATADGNMTGGEKHALNWELTNAIQRFQHAAFVYANFVMAA